MASSCASDIARSAIGTGPSAAQWGSRSVECFEKVEQVGEGTYGQVYKARNKETGEIVALKRVRMDNEKEGFPVTAIREIKILKILNHKNIVRLKEIVTSKASEYNHGKGSIYMVMEFSDHDLTGLTDGGWRFTVPQIKCYMKQLLEGIMYCHKNKVLHRDIKGSNLLINNEGQLKLADFGLARPYDTDQQRNYTNRVITLWYRPPELLLGAQLYGTAIDMWSVGCILAELLVRKPILPGRNEFEQLELIFKLLGTPTETTWPGVNKLQFYDMIVGQQKFKFTSRFNEKFGQLDSQAQDLLTKLLCMDPEKRISARDALDHDYFWMEPFPARPDQLPKYPPSHEFTTKKKRQAAQLQQGQQGQQQGHQQGYPNAGIAAHQPAHQQGGSYHGVQHQPPYSQQQQQYHHQQLHHSRGQPPQQQQQHHQQQQHQQQHQHQHQHQQHQQHQQQHHQQHHQPHPHQPPYPAGGAPGSGKRYRDEPNGPYGPQRSAGGAQQCGMARQPQQPQQYGQLGAAQLPSSSMMSQAGRGHPPNHASKGVGPNGNAYPPSGGWPR